MRLSGFSPTAYASPTFRGSEQQPKNTLTRSELSRLESGTYYQKKEQAVATAASNVGNNGTHSLWNKMMTTVSEYWPSGKKDASEGLPSHTKDLASDTTKTSPQKPSPKETTSSPETMV
ncbi:MAG: hypothetical protein K0Q50_447 [Vampirovibrio sp.]|jgi:hypothetical protein|nr:hypothetical protein [Vampirovibrio sp.]